MDALEVLLNLDDMVCINIIHFFHYTWQKQKETDQRTGFCKLIKLAIIMPYTVSLTCSIYENLLI